MRKILDGTRLHGLIQLGKGGLIIYAFSFGVGAYIVLRKADGAVENRFVDLHEPEGEVLNPAGDEDHAAFVDAVVFAIDGEFYNPV